MKKIYTLHTPTSKKLAKVFIHMCSFSLNSYPLKCVKLNLEGLVWETRTDMLQLFWPESNASIFSLVSPKMSLAIQYEI